MERDCDFLMCGVRFCLVFLWVCSGVVELVEWCCCVFCFVGITVNDNTSSFHCLKGGIQCSLVELEQYFEDVHW